MTLAEEYFNLLTKEIPGIKTGKMFGALCMKTSNGKSIAIYWEDTVVVKLQGDSRKIALMLNGVKLFEPITGRFMSEWVQIPYLHQDVWKDYILKSIYCCS
jgi:hypothetical protein